MPGRRMNEIAAKTFEIIFPFNKTSIILNVNPEEYSASAPHRQDVVQTLTGVVVDAFGAGIGTGSISGTCGWGKPLTSRQLIGPSPPGMDGLTQFLHLKRQYQLWQDFQVQAGDPAKVPCEIANYIDKEQLDVVFTGLEYRHSVSRPFQISFTLSWRILKDYWVPFRQSALVQISGGGNITPGDTPVWPDLPSNA